MLLRGVAQNRVRRLFEVDRGGGAGTFQISGIDHRSLSDFRLPFTETLQVGGVPAFQVLSNAALAEFAERQPLTVQEAMEINGIGPVKAATVVPLFLEAVRL